MFEDLAETAEEARVVGVLCDRCLDAFKADDLVLGIVEWDVNFVAWVHAASCPA